MPTSSSSVGSRSICCSQFRHAFAGARSWRLEYQRDLDGLPVQVPAVALNAVLVEALAMIGSKDDQHLIV